MLIKISETLTSRSSKITGRFSLALTRDIQGYTQRWYQTHLINIKKRLFLVCLLNYVITLRNV